jgi:Leucine-rich repeat (LRR) protein
VITKLTNLRRLYAQNLQLTRLPETIGNLTKLHILSLNGNCFTRLPSSMGKLERLRDLTLNGVAWYKARQNQVLSKNHFEDMLQDQNLMRWLEQNDKVQ